MYTVRNRPITCSSLCIAVSLATCFISLSNVSGPPPPPPPRPIQPNKHTQTRTPYDPGSGGPCFQNPTFQVGYRVDQGCSQNATVHFIIT